MTVRTIVPPLSPVMLTGALVTAGAEPELLELTVRDTAALVTLPAELLTVAVYDPLLAVWASVTT